MLVENQGAAYVEHVASFTLDRGERFPTEDASLDPALAKRPDMWVWPTLVPAVAALDRAVGEPSIFRQFAQFPAGWLLDGSGDEATVTAEQFRGRQGGPTAAGPTCSRAAATGHVAPATSAATASVARLMSSVVVLDTDVDCDRLLVYTDTWAPSWRVWVDGRETRALRVDNAIRGALVPAGRHTVEWRYRPRSLGVQLAVMVACGLGAMLLVAVPARSAAPRATGPRQAPPSGTVKR
jgi:hypothetical protein